MKNRITSQADLDEGATQDFFFTIERCLGGLALKVLRTDIEVARGSDAYLQGIIDQRGLRLA